MSQLVFIAVYFHSILFTAGCSSCRPTNSVKALKAIRHIHGKKISGGWWRWALEWCLAIWSVFLPLLIFPCTIKSRSSLLAPAHPGGPGKRAVKWLWWRFITTAGKRYKPLSTSSLCGRLIKGLLDIVQLNGRNGSPITAAKLSVEFTDTILPRCKQTGQCQ